MKMATPAPGAPLWAGPDRANKRAGLKIGNGFPGATRAFAITKRKYMNLSKTMLKLIGGCGALAMLSGCASIMCGPRQSVAIDSKPTGAEVMVYDSTGDIIFHKSTPCVANLTRRDADYGSANYVVLIRKAGYDDVQVPMSGC